jgi:hypothetical protein
VLYDPGRVSSAVAITHAYWCLPAGARGRPLLYECHGARSLHFRYGLSVDLSTLRHGRCLARRKTEFPLAGWALTGRESHPLDECGFVWTHAPFHPRALPRFLGSMGRSDSRSALAHFTGTPLIGFDAPSPPLSWHPRGLTAGAETGISCSHDGCLTVPRPLRRRVLRGCTSKFLRPFHGLRLELPGSAPCWSLTGQFWRRGRLRLMLRTGESHPPKEGLTPRFGAQVSPNVGGLLQR